MTLNLLTYGSFICCPIMLSVVLRNKNSILKIVLKNISCVWISRPRLICRPARDSRTIIVLVDHMLRFFPIPVIVFRMIQFCFEFFHRLIILNRFLWYVRFYIRLYTQEYINLLWVDNINLIYIFMHFGPKSLWFK